MEAPGFAGREGTLKRRTRSCGQKAVPLPSASDGPSTLTPQELERRSRQWRTPYGRRLLDAMHVLDLKNHEVAEDYRFLETLAFEPRTPLDALLAIQAAGRLGLPAPPWAAERFDQIVEARIKGRCQSLDEAFSFSARGRGEHKRAAVYQRLLAGRDERLALSVHRLRVCGLTLDKAVRRTALKEGHREAEDPRRYRLQLIRAHKADGVRSCNHTTRHWPG